MSGDVLPQYVWVCVTVIEDDMSVSAHRTADAASAEAERVKDWAGSACETAEVHRVVVLPIGVTS